MDINIFKIEDGKIALNRYRLTIRYYDTLQKQNYLDEDCDDCNEYGCCDECECNENNGYCYNEDYGFYLIDDDYNDED